MALASRIGLPLAELPDSPKYRFTAEKSVQVRTFQGDWPIILQNVVGVGAVLDGYICTDCAVEKMPGERGQMTVTCEVGPTLPGGGDVPLPADEWAINPTELSPGLAQHPNFSALTEAQFELVENELKSLDAVTRAAWAAAVVGAGSTPLTNYKRLRAKGVENYYLVALEYSWTARYRALPSLGTGGALGTPGGPGAAAVAGLVGWNWLRKADVPNYSGGVYTVVRSWLGGPAGHWDIYLYT